MSKENRPIIERHYYAVSLVAASPVCIRSGDSEHSKMDLLRNKDGEAFIPGTSFAGAFRERLHAGKKKDSSFGFADGEDGHMSAVHISDFYFSSVPVVSLRDGVDLKDDKSVANKFDVEIIETGATGTLFINYIKRKGDKWEYAREIADMLEALERGEIRIGARKNRGFGRFTVTEIRERSFNKAKLYEWMQFVPNRKDLTAYDAPATLSDWVKTKTESFSPEYITVKVPLRLTGGLSIRKYSTQPSKANYEQLTCNGEPVIPGSTWSGAIRTDATRILRELNCKNVEKTIKDWFGDVDKNTKKAHQSMIAFEESVLQKPYTFIPITRNQVSRFSAATVKEALYSEIMVAQGTTDLILHVRKDPVKSYKALIGLMLLVIEDLKSGMLPIGGLTAVGRGIFAEREGCAVTISGGCTEKECAQALYKYVYGEKSDDVG